jgi:GDPmannose 4,6-dehydratase
MPAALIIGVNGQDGSYLAELLLHEGYEVHGTVRRASLPRVDRIAHLMSPQPLLTLHYADLTDAAGIIRLVDELQPAEVYNLGAMSDVGASFDTPHYTGTVTGLGALNVLEAVRLACPTARYYQAGSSEMFGLNHVAPFNELSRFRPISPYAAAKVYAHHMTTCYRDAYGLFAVNGILFNHESERRGPDFVTRKITLGVAAICAGRASKITLGNIEARRDWGYAPEYMVAAYNMMQAPHPGDYVIATGEAHSVREFADAAFRYAGLDWEKYTEVSSELIRPADVPLLAGDASKAQSDLGWSPVTKFSQLVEIMMEHDLTCE